MNLKLTLQNRYYLMKRRCYDTKCPNYNNYGGRGITVCDEWQTFKGYCEFMIPTFGKILENSKPRELQIDRINNNGNYEPDNVRVVSAKENTRNRRSSHNYTYNGINLNDWSVAGEISQSGIRSRIEAGLSVEEAFTRKVRKETFVRFKGECLTYWAKELGCDVSLLRKRIAKGMSVEIACTQPVNKEKQNAALGLCRV